MSIADPVIVVTEEALIVPVVMLSKVLSEEARAFSSVRVIDSLPFHVPRVNV